MTTTQLRKGPTKVPTRRVGAHARSFYLDTPALNRLERAGKASRENLGVHVSNSVLVRAGLKCLADRLARFSGEDPACLPYDALLLKSELLAAARAELTHD